MCNQYEALTIMPVEAPSAYRLKVEAEMVRYLYEQTRTLMLGVIAAAGFVAIVFYNNIENDHVLFWIAIVYGLTFIRYLSAMRFKSKKRSPEDTIKWGWIFTFFAFLSGCTWGAASMLFFTPENTDLVVVLTMTIMSITITSMAILSSFIWAYFAYAIPTMLPLVWQYMNVSGHEYAVFGILIIVFIATLLPFAKINNRTLRQSVILRFENIDLVHQLIEQKEKSDEANIAKTKFLAAASHDLRQPLHAIGLFLGVLEDRVEKEDKKIVQKIQKASYAFTGLLDSILDISKLDAEVVRVEKKFFYVQDLFDELNSEFELSAIEKGLRLRFVGTRICLHSDRYVLTRIIRNLISNAIKYTNKGGVVIGCRRYKGKILLAVYDTGVGVHENEIERIFREFYQLHNPEMDGSKGLGLGLSIVKRMAELLDAPLLIESIPNKGSMFGLVMPGVLWTGKIDPVSKSEQKAVFFDDKLILIIDDEIEICDSLSELLQSWHCSVIVAASGKEALNIMSNNNKTPDILLVDYRLRDSEMANDAICKIQSMVTGHTVPVIIITGDTEPDRIKEANASGYKILHKPVLPDELRNILSNI
ncbi:MAG: ATP-binding protein, partial [Gammaproteobacteria bacterium]|nr:ATP-binding protein [Gammaproteobacteria bacterium]